METEQLASEWQLDKQWNEGINKDVLWNQWEWRHNVLEFWDIFKAVSRGKFTAINAWEARKDLKSTPYYQNLKS